MAFDFLRKNRTEGILSHKPSDEERKLYSETVNLGTWPMNMLDGEWISLPIQWQVMSRADGITVLISRYVLDCRPYNDLDKWLKEQFVPRAFTEEEQELLWGVEKARLPQTTFFSERCLQMNPGILHGEAGRYARERGVSVSFYLKTTPNPSSRHGAFSPCWWWLGDKSERGAMAMNPDRTKSCYEVDMDDIGVRPCIILEDSVYDGMEKTPFIPGCVSKVIMRYYDTIPDE